MTHWRVRLYGLTRGDWEELGTGQLSLEDRNLTLQSEQSDEVLLRHVVQEEIYRLQGRTIVLFSTEELRTYALSLQTEAETTQLLGALCDLQGRHLSEIPQEDSSDTDEELPESDSLLQLPIHLKELRLMGRDAQEVAKEALLMRLDELLVEFEREKSPLTRQLFEVYRELLQWCSEPLLLSLLGDVHYLSLFGALECNFHADGPGCEDADFRGIFLKSKFTNILESNDQMFLTLISRCYRLQVLKDTALPREVDETCITFLATTQIGLWSALVDHFLQSNDLQRRFCDSLRELTVPILAFMKEFNTMAKSITPILRVEFYELLLKEGDLMSLLCRSLESKSGLTLLEVYSCAVVAVPVKAREGLAQSKLLSLLCSGFLEAEEISAIQMFAEVLRALMEPISEVRINEILDAMYELLPGVVTVLKKPPNDEVGRIRVNEVLAMLRLCVEHHGFRVRYLLGNQEVLRACAALLPDTALVVGTLQFLRTVVDRRDSYLAQQLANENVLDEVWRLFEQHEQKETLVFSQCLSLARSVQKAESRQLDAAVSESDTVLKSTRLKQAFAEVFDRVATKRRRASEAAEKRVKC